MDIAQKYSPQEIEDKWYKRWMDSKIFHSEPDEREPYTIVIPPPNVTGVLHMGHMLNDTLQDVLVRRARMMGKNACWVPGTDHASIATEAKVVAKLRKEGIKKSDLSRDEFLKHCWEWTNKHGGIILSQLKRLGASCDWERTRFTMEKSLSTAVIDTFIDLYNKGYIYQGLRMVNWDTVAKTALSDEEVIHKEMQSKLYYVKYPIVGSDESLTIATTRPETILGDTAVCVHPDDERYTHLHGKKVIIPMINREVPIICDEYVDREFGTGCLKITPAHDINDYEIGQKHNLEIIDVLNEDGTLSAAAQLYVGKDRFEVREIIAEDLKQGGCLEKVEIITNNMGFSERTDSVIEPRLSKQWFCKMEALAKPALEHVMNDDIHFVPQKFKNAYKHWMENIKDWCISRQLWWGHQIPVWYCVGDDHCKLECKEPIISKEKPEKCPHCGSSNLKQDEDVLDTWFSSWLWPISVFDGFENPDNSDINYYYPTNDLVTAPEIMFFWVARMIMAGYEYRKELPFKNVYYHGIVRDKQGRKMSKSLGNSPDPIGLIEKFGADGVRVGMLLCSPAGNDILFDESLCEQGRNFANKIWNAFRLVKSWGEKAEQSEQKPSAKAAIRWFDAKLNESIETIEKQFDEFRISEALMSVYKLIWDDFCSWYLEAVKPTYGTDIDLGTLKSTQSFFDRLLKILHPFMPFVTEEIWHLLGNRKEDEYINQTLFEKKGKIDKDVLKSFSRAEKIITGIRNIRKEKDIANKEAISLFVKTKERLDNDFESLIQKMANLDKINYTDSQVENAISFLAEKDECYIPAAGLVDVESELSKIKEQMDYYKGFLAQVEKKLSNERFVNNAPEQVVALERKKKSDAESKLKSLEAQLSGLKKQQA